MKSRADVDIVRKQRHCNKNFLALSVSTNISVLALNSYYRIILWFHFIHLSYKFVLLYHIESKKSSIKKYPSDKSEGYWI